MYGEIGHTIMNLLAVRINIIVVCSFVAWYVLYDLLGAIKY